MLSQNNKLEKDYGFIHQGFTPKGDVDKYKKFRTDLIMSIEKKTFNKNKKRAKTLLTVMGENAEEAGKMICIVSDGNTERPVHLLEFLNVKEFVDCFNGIDNRKKRIIYSKIEERFKFIENRDWLLDEKDFVEKTINYIEKKIKGVKYSPSVFHLNQLLKTLEDSLKKMNSIKNDK